MHHGPCFFFFCWLNNSLAPPLSLSECVFFLNLCPFFINMFTFCHHSIVGGLQLRVALITRSGTHPIILIMLAFHQHVLVYYYYFLAERNQWNWIKPMLFCASLLRCRFFSCCCCCSYIRLLNLIRVFMKFHRFRYLQWYFCGFAFLALCTISYRNTPAVYTDSLFVSVVCVFWLFLSSVSGIDMPCLRMCLQYPGSTHI